MRVSIPVLLALTVGCATGAAVRDIVAPARAQGQAGPNYEYDWLTGTHSTAEVKQILASHGREGWRLVAVSGMDIFFERQLPR